MVASLRLLILVEEHSVNNTDDLVHWECTQSENHGHDPVLELKTLICNLERERTILDNERLEDSCRDPDTVEEGILEHIREYIH